MTRHSVNNNTRMGFGISLCSNSKSFGARSNFWGMSGSEDRGGGDNSIQFINIGRVGDKSFKE